MGVTINPLRKVNGKVGKTAKELVKKWKQLLPTDPAPNHKVIEKEQFKNSRKTVERGIGKLPIDIHCTTSSTSSKKTRKDKHDYRPHPLPHLPVVPSFPSPSGQSSKLQVNKMVIPTNLELSEEPDSRKRKRNILLSISIMYKHKLYIINYNYTVHHLLYINIIFTELL